MDRAARISQNEALFRTVNEQVEDLQRGMAAVSDDKMHIVCECGELACVDRLAVSVGKYEEIRSDSTLFFVVPGHEIPDVEDVVERADGFAVVRKHPGEPGRVAEETDTRA